MPFQPAMDAADSFMALHDMMSKIMATIPQLLEDLANTFMISSKCQLINVDDDDHGTVKKCLLTITTEQP